jgi:competence protein ComEA
MRNDGAAVAAARLEALSRAAPAQGWVPDPTLLDPAPERADPLEPDVERFWSGVDPLGPPPGRAVVSRRAAVAVVAVVAAVVAGIAIRVGLPSGDVSTVPPAPPPTSRSVAAQPVLSTVSESATVVVHVAGQVKRGGLVTLPAGSRVADAVRAAGGARPAADLGGLNLARRLVDGEQVVVPGRGQALPAHPATGSPGGSPGSSEPVDLNAATEAQFDSLPGIGPVLAGRIVAWRQQHGRFTSVDELAEVQGIGDKLLAGLRDQVRV